MDGYTIGCLLDYSYFKNSYQLIATDRSTSKTLEADLMTIQQIDFNRYLRTKPKIRTIHKQSKETNLRVS